MRDTCRKIKYYGPKPHDSIKQVEYIHYKLLKLHQAYNKAKDLRFILHFPPLQGHLLCGFQESHPQPGAAWTVFCIFQKIVTPGRIVLRQPSREVVRRWQSSKLRRNSTVVVKSSDMSESGSLNQITFLEN